MQGADSYFHLSFSFCDFFCMYVISANLIWVVSSSRIWFLHCESPNWSLGRVPLPLEFTSQEAACRCMILPSSVWNLLAAPLLSRH